MSRARPASAAPAAGTSASRYSVMGSGLRNFIGYDTVGTTNTFSVVATALGSPGYDVNDLIFAFANYWQLSNGSAEVAADTDYTVHDLRVYDGANWRVSSDVPKVVPAGGGALVRGLTGFTVPANTLIWVVAKISFATLGAAVKIPAGSANFFWGSNAGPTTSDRSQGFSAGQEASANALLPAAGPGVPPTWGNSGTGKFIPPVMCFAKGGDGRPAVVIAGDSIGYGQWQDNQSRSWTDRREFGYVSVGLDDAGSAKRLAYANLCIPGQNPGSWSSRSHWFRKLDLLKQVTDLQGALPFDVILSQHGENSCSAAKQLTTVMPGWYALLKAEWPGKPIVQIELLPRCNSTDVYRTNGNMTTTTDSTGVADNNVRDRESYQASTPALRGDRWLFNDACAPGGAMRTAGHISGSIPAWRYGAQNDTDKRDLLAARPFTTTLSGAYNSGLQQLPLNAAASAGHHLVVGGLSGYVGVVSTTGTGGLTANCAPNAFSGAGSAAGQNVWEIPHDDAGVHPSGVMHAVYAAAIIDWKVQQGWT